MLIVSLARRPNARKPLQPAIHPPEFGVGELQKLFWKRITPTDKRNGHIGIDKRAMERLLPVFATAR